MTFLEVINLLKTDTNSLVIFMIILCTLIEITPIKLSPLSFFSRLAKKGITPLIQQITDEVGSNLKQQIAEEVGNNLKQTITEEIQEVNKKIDENRIKEIRWQIITFANNLPSADRDMESFENIYDLHDEYEKLLDRCKLKNGKVNRAMKKIKIYYTEMIEQECENAHH